MQAHHLRSCKFHTHYDASSVPAISIGQSRPKENMSQTSWRPLSENVFRRVLNALCLSSSDDLKAVENVPSYQKSCSPLQSGNISYRKGCSHTSLLEDAADNNVATAGLTVISGNTKRAISYEALHQSYVQDESKADNQGAHHIITASSLISCPRDLNTAEQLLLPGSLSTDNQPCPAAPATAGLNARSCKDVRMDDLPWNTINEHSLTTHASLAHKHNAPLFYPSEADYESGTMISHLRSHSYVERRDMMNQGGPSEQGGYRSLHHHQNTAMSVPQSVSSSPRPVHNGDHSMFSAAQQLLLPQVPALIRSTSPGGLSERCFSLPLNAASSVLTAEERMMDIIQPSMKGHNAPPADGYDHYVVATTPAHHRGRPKLQRRSLGVRQATGHSLENLLSVLKRTAADLTVHESSSGGHHISSSKGVKEKQIDKDLVLRSRGKQQRLVKQQTKQKRILTASKSYGALQSRVAPSRGGSVDRLLIANSCHNSCTSNASNEAVVAMGGATLLLTAPLHGTAAASSRAAVLGRTSSGAAAAVGDVNKLTWLEAAMDRLVASAQPGLKRSHPPSPRKVVPEVLAPALKGEDGCGHHPLTPGSSCRETITACTATASRTTYQGNASVPAASSSKYQAAPTAPAARQTIGHKPRRPSLLSVGSGSLGSWVNPN
ncbi:hypothetical protein CEUSTIGMA_g10565.t1 [Chlamydomonas eustigma]|uniref:Uncharacterized protein n=1 Tax=Chlamydomonas eustigma TaxID=1157962 RepID=A0A250XJP0_9CHLO|nr:hypothetical protein CEUSTIGMA_g10565.t1 [Chlamydomonas eustigma]|eukprot:GAX83139.1 hypothetical protein CEUSTIGMA_g10565.t1 [Chlamydomonas eustigma]